MKPVQSKETNQIIMSMLLLLLCYQHVGNPNCYIFPIDFK